MAVQLCTENSVMSPRISFSYDLSQFDVVPVEPHIFQSNSSTGIDFDFCVRHSPEDEPSSADELFADGKILPTQIKKKVSVTKEIHQQEVPGPEISAKAENSGSGEKQSPKPFWRFNRSCSLNCGSAYARSLCPFPLLSRSNSTGSATSVKRSSPTSWKKAQKSGSYQRPPPKKGCRSNGNGIRVSPVLNVPSSHLFGLGSIFFGGKEKRKKK
ncbi:hypothetical protein NMG60_11006183 [Bertholletia excelsa]